MKVTVVLVVMKVELVVVEGETVKMVAVVKMGAV